MFCEKCGAKNQEHAKFCEKCGAPIQEAPTTKMEQAKQSPARTHKKQIIAGSIILLVVLACVIGFLVYFNSQKQTEYKGRLETADKYLLDSIQEICKERSILKREYMANLKLPGYIFSKLLVQAVLGLIQSIFLTGMFLLLLKADEKGILFSHFHVEVLLTVWITVLASITMGFIISSMVKTGDKAMAEQRTCPVCGTEIESGQRFCISCGNQLN